MASSEHFSVALPLGNGPWFGGKVLSLLGNTHLIPPAVESILTMLSCRHATVIAVSDQTFPTEDVLVSLVIYTNTHHIQPFKQRELVMSLYSNLELHSDAVDLLKKIKMDLA
jgi:hypothetical protein